jgi:hypothetical protein
MALVSRPPETTEPRFYFLEKLVAGDPEDSRTAAHDAVRPLAATTASTVARRSAPTHPEGSANRSWQFETPSEDRLEWPSRDRSGWYEVKATAVDSVTLGVNADDAYAGALDALVQRGQHVDDARPYADLNVASLTLTSPLDRITQNPAKPFDVVTAVARFVWMMAGSDRLADIAFYQPRVGRFTDNGLGVPGSDYGMRILQPEPGLDQLTGVIDRLRANPVTRRAAMVIWNPQDAVRASNDVPCAFGTFYTARDGGVIATTVMRSNNAFTLLPWNLFEFTLLAEVVAAEVELSLASYQHLAVSLHLFDDERQRAEEGLRAYAADHASWARDPMPPMPPAPRLAITELAKLEAKLRHDGARAQTASVADLLSDGADLPDYWRHFYRVLLLHALLRHDRVEIAEQVVSVLPTYFQADASRIVSAHPGAAQVPDASAATATSAPSVSSSTQRRRAARAALAEAQGEVVQLREAVAGFDRMCDLLDRSLDPPVSRRELSLLQQRFLFDQSLAARQSEAQTLDVLRNAITEMRRTQT